MKAELWYVIVGLILVAIVFAGTLLKRLPLTVTIFYLGIGIALGPLALNVAHVDAVQQAPLLERLSELAVIISLFTAGLKLRLPVRRGKWGVPLRLASVSMILTVGMVAIAGVYILRLPLGAAVLLGAILAPTDPVLASDVQLESAVDRQSFRFSITGEAGLNDGTAFPFVMLGLGWLGLHELGERSWRWFTTDVLWASIGGLAIGAIWGTLLGKMVLYLRRKRREGAGSDEFLAFGIIGISYGTALLAGTYGFLAVFAAGLALRRIGNHPIRPDHEIKGDLGPACMADAVLVSNERAERLFEVGMVLLVGLMFKPEYLVWSHLVFTALLFLLIRPIAVFAGLVGTHIHWREQGLLAWFGIRGIGSIYYLMHAIVCKVDLGIAQQFVGLTVTVVGISVLVHGVSGTPLMQWHESSRRRA